MNTARVCIILACILLFTGCVKYTEEWTFDRLGRGTIRITCEPSEEWKMNAQSTNWLHTVQFFIPPYHSLSQECARSGLRILECTVHRTEPLITIVFAFDRLQQVSRCSLFADRLLQWRWGYKRRSMTFLHKLHTTASILPTANGHRWHPDWLTDGSVELRIAFPGNVTEVEGAELEDKYVVRRTSLTELFDNDSLLIMVSARKPFPWFLVICILLTALMVPAGIYFILRRRLKRSLSRNADTTTHSHYC
jgi:hypothetical protein